MRFLPPAGVPLKMTEIFESVTAGISRNDENAFLYSIAERLHVNHVIGTGSGRTALLLILKVLHRLRPERDIVAIPAYTCFSVAAAVARAGLKIYPVEMNRDTLDFDSTQLETLPKERLLCIVACSLFGIPNDFDPVHRAARVTGAYVIDDAAQALGAKRNGRYAGTFGDVGFYSLGRGKTVGTISGGLIATNSTEIAAAIDEAVKRLPSGGLAKGARLVAEMMGYSIFLKPRLFWIPNSLPFIGLGSTKFEPWFSTDGLHPFCARLFLQALSKVDEVNEIRRANAMSIIARLGHKREFVFPGSDRMGEPTFVRLPVVARDRYIRDTAVHRLRAAGIGATAFYPSAICDIPGIQEHMCHTQFHRTRAEDLSGRLLTLPVHPLVNSKDISRMTQILSGL